MIVQTLVKLAFTTLTLLLLLLLLLLLFLVLLSFIVNYCPLSLALSLSLLLSLLLLHFWINPLIPQAHIVNLFRKFPHIWHWNGLEFLFLNFFVLSSSFAWDIIYPLQQINEVLKVSWIYNTHQAHLAFHIHTKTIITMTSNYSTLTSSYFVHSSLGRMVFVLDSCIALEIRNSLSSWRLGGRRRRASFTTGVS